VLIVLYASTTGVSQQPNFLTMVFMVTSPQDGRAAFDGERIGRVAHLVAPGDGGRARDSFRIARLVKWLYYAPGSAGPVSPFAIR
jgi:hypothetical protein